MDTSISIGRNTSIGVDSSNKAHISYYDDTNYDLKYATNASGSWAKQTLISQSTAGHYKSIALDSLDKVHISYNSGGELRYTTNASGSWVTEDPAAGSDKNSIAVDSSGKVHISTFGCGNNCVQYSTNVSGAWVTQAIDTTNQNGGSSIAVDSSDNVHIAYVSANEFVLKYATNASGSWVTETVGSGGWSVSIAVDSSGNVHISNWDNNTRLKYITNSSGSWVAEPVDNDAYVGGSNSIAVDSSDHVHISYYDGSNGDLKYATNAYGSWVTESVDSSGNVGQNSSIAVDSSDIVHISYLDGTNGSLKYAATNVAVLSGMVVINEAATYCTSRNVTLMLSSTSAHSICFSNDNITYSDWEDCAASRSWTLSEGDGTKYVYVKYKDETGNVVTVSDSITLWTGDPMVIEWDKTFKTGGYHSCSRSSAGLQTGDGGYILVGWTGPEYNTVDDIFVVKTDSSGAEQWSQTYGDTGQESAGSVIQTSDGGYLIAGYTTSYGAGGQDAWIIKTDSSGIEQWSQTYGDTGQESANSVVQTSDGGYLIAGHTSSMVPGAKMPG